MTSFMNADFLLKTETANINPSLGSLAFRAKSQYKHQQAKIQGIHNPVKTQ